MLLKIQTLDIFHLSMEKMGLFQNFYPLHILKQTEGGGNSFHSCKVNLKNNR